MKYTKDDLKNILPHREPMLLVDDAESINIDGDTKAVGHYRVRGDEYFLMGHFPNNPTVPGVILCEMTSQSSAVIFADKVKEKTPYFTGINNVKFKRQVHVNDTLEFRTSLTRTVGSFYFIKGEAYVNGELCMSGDFSFALV